MRSAPYRSPYLFITYTMTGGKGAAGGSRGQQGAAEVRSEDSDAAGEIWNTFKRGDLLETTHLFCGAKLMCVHG